uniref:REJ domain-containing protein n=1 Tax=Macrostomum lignano TaxID=282301 RepID=A0A1I8H2B1_9PLAT
SSSSLASAGGTRSSSKWAASSSQLTHSSAYTYILSKASCSCNKPRSSGTGRSASSADGFFFASSSTASKKCFFSSRRQSSSSLASAGGTRSSSKWAASSSQLTHSSAYTYILSKASCSCNKPRSSGTGRSASSADGFFFASSSTASKKCFFSSRRSEALSSPSSQCWPELFLPSAGGTRSSSKWAASSSQLTHSSAYTYILSKASCSCNKPRSSGTGRSASSADGFFFASSSTASKKCFFSSRRQSSSSLASAGGTRSSS